MLFTIENGSNRFRTRTGSSHFFLLYSQWRLGGSIFFFTPKDLHGSYIFCLEILFDLMELVFFFFYLHSAAATGTAYPTAQPNYAVAPTATGTQRPGAYGYDQVYQAAATQGPYASKWAAKSLAIFFLVLIVGAFV